MIHIVDDFLADPFNLRSIALKKKYAPERYNYPGVRCREVPDSIVQHVLSQVRYYTKESAGELSNPAFHYVTKEFLSGNFHTDAYKYICIVYLSLESPSDSGTEICDKDQEFREDVNNEKIFKIIKDFHKNPSDLIIRYNYARVKRKLLSFYKPIMKIPNKFNRGLIFPAWYFHRAQNFFGTSIEDSRLTLVSFVDSIKS